jgi:DNA-binding PadR family transcriptional regulator
MVRDRRSRLSTADLVLLSLLTERSMHGYQANAELERREVRDWAELSRPQIYYSLEKLARAGLLRRVSSRTRAEGPERQVFSVTPGGREALRDALERQDWCMQRPKPPFLTWMALSWQARKGVFERQLERRREFLKREITREKETVQGIRKEVGHRYHEALWMVTLMISEFQCELRWLSRVQREMLRRAPARRQERAERATSHPRNFNRSARP